ncbi:MAG: hypothetical protein NC938_00675 [Candidatus Omnitrophica bacterium]|nr:hypothetical protein [Candidatus Omnitrophota bacterium]MCM8790203.1 hypothetical protein [Candidatus Omnitrophota bacterium]
MNRTLKMTLLSAVALVATFFLYRLVFIRTVNYEIGGIKIPSKYNALTGKVTPIINYRGGEIKKTVTDHNTNKIGMSGEEVTLAQFRWAIFEQWANSRPKYKGWQSNPAIFKAANEAFRKEMESSGQTINIIK